MDTRNCNVNICLLAQEICKHPYTELQLQTDQTISFKHKFL